MTENTLPEWVTNRMPKTVDYALAIDHNGEQYTVGDNTFNTFTSAWYYIAKSDAKTVITEKALRAAGVPDDEFDSQFFNISGCFVRQYRQHDSVISTRRLWAEALDSEAKYKKNTNSSIHAWNFLSHHPLFWRYDEKIGWIAEGMRHAWIDTFPDAGLVTIEHGEYDHDVSGWVHDWIMDVCEKSFDDAIVSYAKNVHSMYTMDARKTGVYFATLKHIEDDTNSIVEGKDED